MPFKPQKIEGRTYTLCGKVFHLYSLDGFQFDDNIEIEGINDTDKGLYCFTQAYKANYTEDTKHFVYVHKPLYLGKTICIDDRPLKKNHEKWENLKADGCNCIGIYLCNSNIKIQESVILDNFFSKRITRRMKKSMVGRQPLLKTR